MNSVTELLTDLRKRNVRVWVDDGKLRCSAPKGGLSPDLHAQLTKRKSELISFLEARSRVAALSVPELRPYPRNGRLPLSFAQERLWFLHQFDPESPSYNIVFNVHLGGLVDIALIERVLTEIVRRHETLRTTFKVVDGQPVAIVNPPSPVKLRVIDLGQLSKGEREREALRLRKEEAGRGFDLANGPLFRGTLLLLGAESELVLNKHHIIADGWSIALLIDEFQTLLRAFGAGEPSPLPELPIQYVDYARWQREWLSGSTLEQALSYWKKQLGGRLPVLELPTDRPRPPVQTFNGALQTFSVPKRLNDALNGLCREEGATPFMALLAAYKLLLSRYSGQEDILVGTTNGSRNRVEIEKLIGFFINTLVLRTDLSGDPTFRDVLRRVKAVVFEALAHQDMPFEKLVEALQPERDLSHSPLFQAFFILQNSPLAAVARTATERMERLVQTQTDGQGTRTDMWDTHVVSNGSGHRFVVETGTAKFDLTLFAVDTGNGLTGNLEYNTDLFDHATITRMLDHFESLLQSVVDTPDERLSRILALPAAERRQLLRVFNETERAYPKDRCLHELISEQAAVRPHDVAVVCSGESLTYGELERQSDQLAHALRVAAVGRGDLIGVCVGRSVRMVVSLLGVLKAGAAYVPLDPAFPRERLAYMLSDAKIRVLITERAYVGDFGSPLRSFCVDDPAVFAGSSVEPLPIGTAPEDLAYVIYTSGSTGRPKGVQIPHRAVVNFLTSMADQPGLKPSDVLVSVTTLSFDIAGLELYLPLTVGARVVIATQAEAADGARLAKLMADSGATVLQATPATWRLLFESGWSGLPGLRMFCGGEQLPSDLARALRDRGAGVWNLYGPTETTIWSTVSPVTDGAPITIGRPIANTEIYLLNAALQPVPLGATGELYIGGDGLARGYLHRPDLTAERFVPHPFSDQFGARLYRTGDLARYLPDGQLECLGRVDHQIKLRGFRIELGEIENALAMHPSVRAAVVHVHEDAAGDRRLVAYVIPRDGAQPTVSELRAAVKETLPEYMVPSLFEFLTAFPLTPNGKVDRKALPAPGGVRPELAADCVLPRSAAEHRIAAIWRDVLGVDTVGIRDNFFELGGHSLLVVKVHSKLQQAFGRDISIVDMFRLPTIEALAEHLAGEVRGVVSFRDAQERAAQRRAAARPAPRPQRSKGHS